MKIYHHFDITYNKIEAVEDICYHEIIFLMEYFKFQVKIPDVFKAYNKASLSLFSACSLILPKIQARVLIKLFLQKKECICISDNPVCS